MYKHRVLRACVKHVCNIQACDTFKLKNKPTQKAKLTKQQSKTACAPIQTSLLEQISYLLYYPGLSHSVLLHVCCFYMLVKPFLYVLHIFL